jgi:hypothetical protein
MKELITEDQANLIILLLSIVVTLASLAFGFYQPSKIEKSKKILHWVNSLLCAFAGPVIWVFWQVYNSIENYYGLDSLKALEINFFIAIGIGAVFFALFYFAPSWVLGNPAAKRSK